MGSPRVFQTAPPQPASKARITWLPQLVGGPEASQKGLGHRMPAKLVERSAIVFTIHYSLLIILTRVPLFTVHCSLFFAPPSGPPWRGRRACRRPQRQPLRARR